MYEAILSNAFGSLGAAFWSIQLIPQIILNYRRHSAAGLSTHFMLLWSLAGIPLGVYNIVSSVNIALQVQAQILTTLSLVTMGQCLYYERRWKLWKVSALVGCIIVLFGSIEYALIYALRLGLDRGVTWPKIMMSVLAAILLVAGVGEQYVAIYRSRSVEGISFLFCGLDALGDITSLVSIAFEKRIDIAGMIIYSTELVFWLGIFALGFHYAGLPRCKRILAIIRTLLSADKGSPGPRQNDPQHATPDILSLSTSVFWVVQDHNRLWNRRERRHDVV